EQRRLLAADVEQLDPLLPLAELEADTTPDQFGRSVSIDGDWAVVGAANAAYVFTRSGSDWALAQALAPADNGANDDFGRSVAISGETVVVGAASADGVVEDAGAAYVFVRTDGVWSQQQKLAAPDGLAGDGFGAAVAISGDAIVVGAPFGDG